jgi:ribosomal protein S8
VAGVGIATDLQGGHGKGGGVMSKYNNRKTQVDGIWFDSKVEAERYRDLRILEAAGEISKLEVHPKFTLVPGFTPINGKREKAITYKADFSYIENGKVIVEDVKSVATRTARDYVMRRKLLQWTHKHILFREVA